MDHNLLRAGIDPHVLLTATNNAHRHLLIEIERWTSIGHYALLQRFVLATGRPFAGRALPNDYRRGREKACFANSIAMAKASVLPRRVSRERLRYVEGYAVGAIPFLFHHAWCIDDADRVVDITLRDPAEYAYFGRIFSVEEWDRETDRTGTMSALDGMGLNHEFMFAEVERLRDEINELRAQKKASTPRSVEAERTSATTAEVGPRSECTPPRGTS